MGESIVINETFKLRPGNLRKNGTRGRGRVTIEVKSEPLLHQFDDLAIGSGPAEAIAEAIRSGITAITASAAPATIEYRRKAARAFDRGALWAKKRYAGGRTGPTPPSPNSSKLFNDSKRLAGGIVARLNKFESGFTVNVPANRLDERDFNDLSFRRMLARLKELVPALNPQRLRSLPTVVKAIDQSIDDLIVKARDDRQAKRIELRQARVRALAAAGRLLGAAARIGIA